MGAQRHPSKRRLLAPLSALALVAALPACGQRPEPSAGTSANAINTNPSSLAEAVDAIAQIGALQAKDPQDPTALAAIAALTPKLDELNHLVARATPAAGHVVSFYEAQPGVFTVTESGPPGDKPILTGTSEKSMVALYQSITGGAQAPQSLLDAQARATAAAAAPGAHDMSLKSESLGGSTAAQQPAAGSGHMTPELTSADGPWWAANACYTGQLDINACLPDWWNGGWFEANTKTSFLEIAPFSGNTIYVQRKYNGTIASVSPVFQGQWQNFWAYSSTWVGSCTWPWACDPPEDYNIGDHRWDLLNAQGSGFHWAYAARWNCDWVVCDTP